MTNSNKNKNRLFQKLIKTCFITLFCFASFTPYAKADTFHLVTAPFKPFTDPDDPSGGFLVEIARESLALRGHELKIVFRPWARALNDAQNGRYDGLLSAYYNEERGKLFHFSAPLNTTRMIFVGMRDKMNLTHYGNFSEFETYTIGVGRKWAYRDDFEKNTKLKKSTVNDEPSGIRMLFNNRIDLFAVNFDQFHRAINNMADYDVRKTYVLEPAISTNDQHIAASRSLPNSEKFLSEFNTGLAALKASGGYKKVRTQFLGF